MLVGFQHAESTWSDSITIGLLVGGVVTVIVAAVHELYTKRSPILPPRLFQTRTTAIILVTVCIHALTFFSIAFYLPLCALPDLSLAEVDLNSLTQTVRPLSSSTLEPCTKGLLSSPDPVRFIFSPRSGGS